MTISERDRDAIAAYVDTLGIEEWPPLTVAQRDLLRRTLGRATSTTQTTDTDPVPVKPVPRVCVYRHYDEREILLYVGISRSAEGRTAQHARYSDWQRFAVRAEAQWFKNRYRAELAESEAIANEKPLFNIAKSVDTRKERVERLTKYLIAHQAWDLLVAAGT